MATTERFGDMAFRTVTPDEIARLARTSILYGLAAHPEEGARARQDVRNVLPILRTEQLAVLLDALKGQLPENWSILRSEILALS